MGMRLGALLICLAGGISIFGGDARALVHDAEYTLSGGYRLDALDWNIAGRSNFPNILSELTWSDLRICQVKGRAAIGIGSLYIRGSLGLGAILEGANQDSDYAGNDRTLEFSRSNNSGRGGSVFDSEAGVGIRFLSGDGRRGIAPLAGFSYRRQRLKIREGVQTIRVDFTTGMVGPLGPFNGLDSSYDTEWRGPWIGIDLFCNVSGKWRLFGTFEYHRVAYRAEADWNLRADLAHPKSFEHRANGEGFVISIGADYSISGNWSIHSQGELKMWSTNPGTHRFFFRNGSSSETRLNEVAWDSSGVMIGLTYRYR
jgi:hypothetical protein